MPTLFDKPNIYNGLNERIIEKFLIYHNQNPHIYKKFKEMALTAILKKKKKHIGAKTLFEIMRWFTDKKGNDEYKVNNNYPACYARLFESEYPKYKGFFRKRERKNELTN